MQNHVALAREATWLRSESWNQTRRQSVASLASAKNPSMGNSKFCFRWWQKCGARIHFRVIHTFQWAGGFANMESESKIITDWGPMKSSPSGDRLCHNACGAATLDLGLWRCLPAPRRPSAPPPLTRHRASSQDEAWVQRSSTVAANPLPGVVATGTKMAAEHVTRGSWISGSRGHVVEAKGQAISNVDR